MGPVVERVYIFCIYALIHEYRSVCVRVLVRVGEILRAGAKWFVKSSAMEQTFSTPARFSLPFAPGPHCEHPQLQRELQRRAGPGSAHSGREVRGTRSGDARWVANQVNLERLESQHIMGVTCGDREAGRLEWVSPDVDGNQSDSVLVKLCTWRCVSRLRPEFLGRKSAKWKNSLSYITWKISLFTCCMHTNQICSS